jgi:hypothetical protein
MRCVSISYCSSAVVAEVLPCATSRDSSTTMRLPVSMSASATRAAVMPAPTIAMSQSIDSFRDAVASPTPLRISQYASLDRILPAPLRLNGHMRRA